MEYCTQCRWLLRAAWVAQELLQTFRTRLGEVALVPGTDGVFRVTLDAGDGPVLLWDRKADGGFPEIPDLKRRVRDAGVHPSRITLELTESALLQGFDSALQTMYALAGSGFRLALDDFGTGYSSLSYLSQLPLHELKVDRAFICGLRPEAPSPLAGFIIDVGRRLGMTTIAEGVETEAQRATLEALGCEAMQGYLACPPLPQEAFEAWLERPGTDRRGAVAGDPG